MYADIAYQAFVRLLMMAFYGSVMIVVVAMARVLLKGAPRWICCMMWAFVAFRLLCPLDLPSGFSVYNLIAADNDGTSAQYIQSSDNVISETSLSDINADILMQDKTGIGPADQNDADSGAIGADGAAYGERASGGRAMHEILIAYEILYKYAPYMTVAWAVGVIFMLGYMIWCSWKLHRTVAASVLSDRGAKMDAGRIRKYLSAKVFICDDISEPFVMGLLSPTIYVPSGMNDENIRFAVAHEREHIIYGDNIWKLVGCIIRAVYWFDPLVWIAYRLFSRDIEIACDERVIKGMNREERAGYSQALLEYGMYGRRMAVYALGFGGSVGSDVKERVNRVINYKRPAGWIVFIAVIACIAAAACFLTGPANRAAGDENGIIIKHSFSESVPDDVVLYADGMAESVAAYYKEKSGNDAIMREADISDISFVPTGTASNDSAIVLYSISFDIRFDGKLDVGNDAGIEVVKDDNGNKWIKTSNDSYAPKYILMQCNADGAYRELCMLSEADIKEYNTPEMTVKYGNVYTAAAAELGAAYGNGLLKALTDSIKYENGSIYFTIPSGAADWNIHISGRVEIEGAEGSDGMSVHYLEDESESSKWISGKTYSFDVSGGGFTELFMDAGTDGAIPQYTDLLKKLPPDMQVTGSSSDSGDNKAHSYRVVDGASVSTGMSWKQDMGMKAFRVWVSNDDDKPMIVRVHSAFGYSKKSEIPAHTAAVVDINNNAHGFVTYELDFDSSDGKTSGYVVVETFDNRIVEDM